jgi:hypothetical protein
MADKRTMIARLLGAVLILLAATLFVGSYNSVQLNIFRYGYNYSLDVLPSLCQLITKAAFVGYILCGLILAVGLFAVLRAKRSPLLHEISIQIAHLGAVVWVLSCLVAWWLPHTYGIGPVK